MTSNFKNIVFIIIVSSITGFIRAEDAGAQSTQEYQVPHVCNSRIAVIDFDTDVDFKKLEIRLVNIAKDNNIHGILLAVDHHGGEVGAFSVIHDLLLRVKRIKPVVALVRGKALSAAYLVVSVADYVIAHSASDIGSIGTYGEIQRWHDVTAKQNDLEAVAKVYFFKSGKYKALGNPYSEDLSQEDKAYIQASLDKGYQLFTNTVARNRNFDINRADEWAEGKNFYGPDALKLGLIDEIGTAIEAEGKLLELMRTRNPDRIISSNVEYIF
jgi:protease IV